MQPPGFGVRALETLHNERIDQPGIHTVTCPGSQLQHPFAV